MTSRKLCVRNLVSVSTLLAAADSIVHVVCRFLSVSEHFSLGFACRQLHRACSQPASWQYIVRPKRDPYFVPVHHLHSTPHSTPYRGFSVQQKPAPVSYLLRVARCARVMDFEAVSFWTVQNLSDILAANPHTFSSLRVLRLFGEHSTTCTQVLRLDGMINLRVLVLSNLNFADITSLTNLPALEILDLSRTDVVDINALRNLTALRTLTLSNTRVATINALGCLSALETLHLMSTSVWDFQPLARLTALKTLVLGKNLHLCDVTFLTGLTNLQTLDLSRTNVVDVTSLAELRSLEKLYLHKTGITDVTALVELRRLQILNLSYTKITDVSALATLSALQELDISFTKIGKVGALASLTALKRLYLTDTEPTDLCSLNPGIIAQESCGYNLECLNLDNMTIIEFKLFDEIMMMKLR